MNKIWHKFYPESVPYDVSAPVMNVYEILSKTTEMHPHEIAIIENDVTTSYLQLKTMTDCFASALYQSGFQKGDRFALMLPNCIEYIICCYAIQRLGGIVVQVNPLYQPDELLHILKDSEASWFLGHYEQRRKLEQIDYLDKIQIIFVNDDQQEKSFQSWLLIPAVSLPDVAIDIEEDISILQYTGGTTGKSKGVMLTHYNVIWNLFQGTATSVGVYEEPGERVLGISPMFHAMGLTQMNHVIHKAATIILMKRFEVNALVEIIRKYRPTVFNGSPTMYIALLNHSDLQAEDLQCFKVCGSGSAPLPEKVIKDFQDKTGAHIIEAYGLSEATTMTHKNPATGTRKVGSIGIPVPSTDCRIVDIETGTREVNIGEPGELLIKGPQVMKGYWKNENETQLAIRDGWLYTGDLAVMDDDGFFYIVGRKKDMIIASGYNIYPKEIEEVIFQNPNVKEACVYGIPDEYRGETVKAAIVLRDKASLTVEELQEWCRNRLARYKVPTHFEFRNELPKTAIGKVLRTKLIEQERNSLKR